MENNEAASLCNYQENNEPDYNNNTLTDMPRDGPDYDCTGVYNLHQMACVTEVSQHESQIATEHLHLEVEDLKTQGNQVFTMATLHHKPPPQGEHPKINHNSVPIESMIDIDGMPKENKTCTSTLDAASKSDIAGNSETVENPSGDVLTTCSGMQA